MRTVSIDGMSACVTIWLRPHSASSETQSIVMSSDCSAPFANECTLVAMVSHVLCGGRPGSPLSTASRRCSPYMSSSGLQASVTPSV